MFTDADSLVYEVEAKDIYEDFYQYQHFFDFSEYPVNSKFYDPTNKTVIGKMKDEFKEK